MSTLNQIEKEIEELKKEIENFKKEIEKLDDVSHDLLIKIIHQKKPETKNHNLVFSTFWHCAKSPNGYCVYDLNSDLRFDDCIFCHQPDERK